MGQLATFKPLSSELKIFENALWGFLLFDAGESLQRQRLIEGESYSRQLLNKLRGRWRERQQGRQRRQKIGKLLKTDADFE